MVKPSKAPPSYLQGRTIAPRRNLTGSAEVEAIKNEVEAITDVSQVPHIPLELLDDNPRQPRKNIDEEKLNELVESMRARGITSVIVARRHPDDPTRYQLVYGHRRREAAKRAGETAYPVLIKDVPDKDMLYWAAEENRFREDLTPVEEGHMFREMLDAGDTQEDIANFYKKQRSYIRDRLALVDAPTNVQELVEARPDTVRVAARELAKEPDEEIRTSVIEALKNEEIAGTQVHAYIETLRHNKAKYPLQQEPNAPAQYPESDKQESPNERVEGSEEKHLQPRENASLVQEPSGTYEHIPSQPQREVLPSPQTILQETKRESATLLEQSRVRSINKQLGGYRERLAQRVSRSEEIPPEERHLLKDLESHVRELLECIEPPLS